MRKMSRTRAIALSLFGLTIGLILAEFLIRLIAPQSPSPLLKWVTSPSVPAEMVIADERMGWVLVADFEGTAERRGTVVTTNAFGVRDRQFPPKGPSETRILSLGDSYAFGEGVNNKETYAKVLEGLLWRRFEDAHISVINGGVPGYSTFQMTMDYDRLRKRVEPDFVIATFVAGNDVWENAVFEDRLAQGLASPLGFLGSHSHLLKLVLRSTFGPRFFIANRATGNIEQTISAFRDFEKRLETDGMPYLIVMVPARHQVRPNVHPASRFLARVGAESYIFRHNNLLKRHFRSAGVPYVDASARLMACDSEEPVYFEDDPHTNVLGHQIIAEVIYQEIEQRIDLIIQEKQGWNRSGVTYEPAFWGHG